MFVVVLHRLVSFSWHVAGPRQLRKQICLDRLLVVPQEELIHVVLELLFAHIVDSLVGAELGRVVLPVLLVVHPVDG